MKKLIELFNKKYGATYGIIDDSIDNEDVYKVYKIIKSLCSDDNEIMDMLNKIKLPNPRTASESIEKINAEHVSGEGLDDLIKYVDNNLPHYNETLMFEISGETDYGSFFNDGYFNINALNLDETKSYVGKEKYDMTDIGEYTYEFVYDKEADTLSDELFNTCIYNHKSYDGTNFIEDENSAVLTSFVAPMIITDSGNGYFKLYEVDKVELDNGCLSDNVSIKNSLTVGSRIGDIGEYSVAEGNKNTASGGSSHAEGNRTTATGGYSHAEGLSTTASGHYSHAEGVNTTASGNGSHAEGNGTTASSNYSHAEGMTTTASEGASHAEGRNTIASGMCSHAEGDNTKASSEKQHVQGKYNIEDTTNTYAHIVGNGTSNGARSNAHTLDWNGNGWYKGKLSQDGTPTEDKDLATKKYVDDKTEILPVKNNYIIFEDAVPTLKMSETSTYGAVEVKPYVFDNLQNEDMISSAIKYNLSITFNDGTNDITKDLILENIYNGNVHYEDEDILLSLEYIEKEHSIGISVNKVLDFSPYDILKATVSYDCYVNLLQNYHIQNIDYDKIERVPIALNRIVTYKDFTLKGKEYYELYDNLFIWDANKFNERLDENSGVKRNEFFKLLGEDKYTMQIKQKDSEGIGFGQHIPIDNSKNVHIVADAGVDVIIKIYNSTTKELIDTLNYCEAGFYKTRILNKGYLNGVTSIFIAFTVEDSTESFYGNTYVNDLIVHYDSSFLVKEEILTKTNTKEYIPTGDYNPATKKYVDERTFSREVVTVNNVNDSLTLTTDKNQYATLAVPVEIILPTVTSFTELHLFFSGSEGVTIGTNNVKWESQVTIENNKSYEIIFTYVNESIGWLGKTIVYS